MSNSILSIRDLYEETCKEHGIKPAIYLGRAGVFLGLNKEGLTAFEERVIDIIASRGTIDENYHRITFSSEEAETKNLKLLTIAGQVAANDLISEDEYDLLTGDSEIVALLDTLKTEYPYVPAPLTAENLHS